MAFSEYPKVEKLASFHGHQELGFCNVGATHKQISRPKRPEVVACT